MSTYTMRHGRHVSPYIDLDITLVAIPHGSSYAAMTRVGACAMYSLARMSGFVDEARFWQVAMCQYEVA